MNNASPELEKNYADAVKDLVETLTDSKFQRALAHPLFGEALDRVIQNNLDAIGCDGPMPDDGIGTLVTVLTNVCTFEVRDGDTRLFVEDHDGGTNVYRDGRFYECDDDGIEFE